MLLAALLLATTQLTAPLEVSPLLDGRADLTGVSWSASCGPPTRFAPECAFAAPIGTIDLTVPADDPSARFISNSSPPPREATSGCGTTRSSDRRKRTETRSPACSPGVRSCRHARPRDSQRRTIDGLQGRGWHLRRARRDWVVRHAGSPKASAHGRRREMRRAANRSARARAGALPEISRDKKGERPEHLAAIRAFRFASRSRAIV